MKLLILLMFPIILFAQKKPGTDKAYARIGAGMMFSKDQDAGPAGFCAIGANVGGFALLGVGFGAFKPPDFSSLVFLVGGELTLVDTKAKISPAFTIGGYKPITSTALINEKVYLTAGAGIGFFNKKQKGGLLTVNYSQFKFDQQSSGYLMKMDRRIIYASFSIII